MEKKSPATYRIRPELDESFSSYARANGKTRTDVITNIIEKYLTCNKFTEKLKQAYANGTSDRKDWMSWKPKTDYLLPSHYNKIKLIAATCGISVSEVMDDILDTYLSKIDPTETLNETLEKVFGKLPVSQSIKNNPYA